MTIRVAAMMALALALTGCATGDDPFLYTSSTTSSSRAMAPALSADVAPDFAIAYLPSVAGSVTGVRQQSRRDAVDQTIVYQNTHYGSDENRLTVSVAAPSRGSSYWQAPTINAIHAEIRRSLPGVAMSIANGSDNNMHGPFGYAVGRSSAEGNCIFAWQTVREIGGMRRKGAFFTATRDVYAAKVRLRYCHRAMDEAGLVSLMRGLRIKEVTDSTLEMLRFAEGSGVAARNPAPVVRPEFDEPMPVSQRLKSEPVLQPRPVARAVVEEVTVEPAIRAPADLRPASGNAAAAAVVRAAPRVVMPSELPGYAEAAKVSVAAAPANAENLGVRRAPAVPLPGDLQR